MHAQIFHFTSDRFIGREQRGMNEWRCNSKSTIYRRCSASSFPRNRQHRGDGLLPKIEDLVEYATYALNNIEEAKWCAAS